MVKSLRKQRIIFPAMVLCISIISLQGCSVYMATKQPPERDLTVLNCGTPRGYVIAELGTPIWSGSKQGHKVDVFAIKQGYSKFSKGARAFLHGAADVFTLCLWEVVGTPLETIADGEEMKIEVGYDGDDKVKWAIQAKPGAFGPEPKQNGPVADREAK